MGAKNPLFRLSRTEGQIVEKHAYGGFFNEFAPFAYEPSARRAANGDRKPLLRKGSETAGRVSKANRGVRTAQSASATPKPKTDRRLGLGRNARRRFRKTIGGVRPSDTSWGLSTV